jgi:hypothetical protein
MGFENMNRAKKQLINPEVELVDETLRRIAPPSSDSSTRISRPKVKKKKIPEITQMKWRIAQE